MNEINNQSLFADPTELTVPAISNVSKNEMDKIIPVEKLSPVLPEGTNLGLNNKLEETIVEVKFCTSGRLSAPAILHFRDYTLLASQELADTDEDNYLASLIRALNSMVIEEFDCGLLHLEEAKEVLLNIYGKWWGDKLTGYKYFINPDIKDEKELLSPENISLADLPLSAIAEAIEPLASDIKEPINVKCHGVTVKFVYPRIQNTVSTEELLKSKFAAQEQQFYRLAQILKYNAEQTDPEKLKEVNIQELENYDNYLKERDKWRIIFLRAHEVCAVDEEIFETYEQRLDAMISKDSKISVKHWQKYNSFLEGKGKFGLKKEVEFYSDILDQKVRRPFQFRTFDFIPSNPVEFSRDDAVEIYFG